jgi:hypothetical protein
MLRLLHDLVGDLLGWAESCPCHNLFRSSGSVSELPPAVKELKSCHEKMGMPVHDGPHFVCPMRAQRALELSLGKLKDVFSELASMYASDLLDVCSELSDDKVALVLASFATAKAFLQLELTTYLSC